MGETREEFERDRMGATGDLLAERSILQSQLAEAEATMEAYRGTIGQRERDVARLTAQVERLESLLDSDTGTPPRLKSGLEARLRMYIQAVNSTRDAVLHRAEAAERQVAQLEQEKAEALALAEKWVQAFNRSEQFQSGPTKRAEAAEARIVSLEGAVESAITFLKSVEWVTNICEDDAFNIVEALRAALQPAAARAPEEPTT